MKKLTIKNQEVEEEEEEGCILLIKKMHLVSKVIIRCLLLLRR